MFSRFCFFIPATLGVLFLLPLHAAEIRKRSVLPAGSNAIATAPAAA